jgi:hypothetical protein
VNCCFRSNGATRQAAKADPPVQHLPVFLIFTFTLIHHVKQMFPFGRLCNACDLRVPNLWLHGQLLNNLIHIRRQVCRYDQSRYTLGWSVFGRFGCLTTMLTTIKLFYANVELRTGHVQISDRTLPR